MVVVGAQVLLGHVHADPADSEHARAAGGHRYSCLTRLSVDHFCNTSIQYSVNYFTMYNVIWSILMRTAFHNEDNSAGWIVYNGISDTLFLVDITINFRTGVHFEGFVRPAQCVPAFVNCS